MTEVWKSIPGFARFSVSDQGRVRRDVTVYRHPPGACAVTVSSTGYPKVALTADDGSYHTKNIHSLVMLAFVGPRPKGMHVCHADGDRLNAKLTNLRYDSPRANVHDAIRHGTQVKGEKVTQHILKAQQVKAIIGALDAGSTYNALADTYGVTKHCIYRIAAGTVWREITGGIDRRNGYKFAHLGGQARWTRAREEAARA